MFKEKKELYIRGKKFKSFGNVLIIGEIGSNHNHNLKKTFKLIDEAKKAGCDAVKFQLFRANKIIQKKYPGWKILKKLELPVEWLSKLKNYAHKKKLFFSATPFDIEAVKILKKVNVDFYKVSSTEIEDVEMIKEIAKTRKSIILSTGAANLSEISNSLEILRNKKLKNIALLHCVSIYPPEISQMNLNMISSLKNAFHLPVGFSDHSMSLTIPAVAVAMGACVIEKHITLSKKSKGPDHHFSLEPKELRLMVRGIREVELSLGSKIKQPIIKNEKAGLARRIISIKALQKNYKIKKEDCIIKRGNPNGILPIDLNKIIGLTLKRRKKADQEFKWSDFK